MRGWSESFDMSTVPDDVLRSEWARRNARKRASYTGGIVWKNHNPRVPGCRCVQCMVRREKEASC